MLCHRKRGQRAVLHKLERLGEDGAKGDDEEDYDAGEKSERRPEHPEKPAQAASAVARGAVVELATGAIVVEDGESGRRLACRVSAEKTHKLEGRKVGDRVKIVCTNGQLAHLGRAPAAELKLVGTISALSSTSITVSGDRRSLTCSVPSALAEKIARFTVGTSVKMLCRGTELAYLERV